MSLQVVHRSPHVRRIVAELAEHQRALQGRDDDGREAEVAVLVEDAWQSRGIGKLLLSRLAGLSGERGVEAFFCLALGENRRVLDLVRAVFPDVSYALRDGAYLIRAPLGSLRAEQGTAREGR